MKKWTAFITGIILVVIFIITMFVVPPLLGWTNPSILSWQDFLDSISTAEGLIIGLVSQAIPVICVTIGAIFLIIFLVKLIRGKE
jgi:ABC-type spermidine/putrescine transport system permease subunit I